ncbi:MarR family winged helix-turn-helix transcriptional regulator [Hylemonella gracilis]|uniref:MarR family winged helix-turn-helix transcriptional regulator n=1 Tax=Hylemonella gracilis TaxID=80880 RepID=UPI0013F16BAE|nr:MarR family transcriptional regulator [Hylemonella gracilis]
MNALREPHRLDELLNFRLHRLHMLSGAPVVRLLEGRHGITRREWRLLALLADRGPLSPSELADQGQLDRTRTSRSIGLLVSKALALRQTSPADPRRACISLTASGQSLYEDVFPQVADINRQLVSVLDEATLNALDRALQGLTDQARQLNLTVAADVKTQRRQGGSKRLLARSRQDALPAGEASIF